MFITIGMADIDTPVLACTKCGAVVWYDLRERHVEFHREVRALERVTTCA